MATASLRRRLFYSFVALDLVPVTAVTGIVGALVSIRAARDVEQNTRALAASISEQIESRLAQRQQAVALLAGVLRLQAVPVDKQRALLAELLRNDATLDTAYVADAAGRIESAVFRSSAVGAESDVTGVDLSFVPLFRDARKVETAVWSDTFPSSLSGQVTVAVAQRAGDRTLLVEMSMAKLASDLGLAGRPGAELLTVIDGRGRIIAHADPTRAARQDDLSRLALVRAAAAGGTAHGEFSWDDVPALGTVMPIGRIGWSVLAAQPVREVYQPLVRLAWVMILAVLAATLGAVGASLLLARRLSERFRRLGEAAQRYTATGVRPELEFDEAELALLWRNLYHLFEQLQKREEQTQEARRRLQTVFDATTEVAIIATDAEGTIRMYNRGAEKLLGWTAAEQVDRASLATLYDAEELRKRALELFGNKGGVVGDFETLKAIAVVHDYDVRDWTYRRRDGRHLPVSVALTAVRDASRQVTGFVAVASDLSARQRVAALEIARQAAEAASGAKTDFLSRVSHELRTPMNAILGFAQLLRGDPRSPPTPVQTERIAQIERAGWYLVRLIDDVMDLSRIEAGTLNVTLEPVDVLVVVQRARDIVEPLLKNNGVSIETAGIAAALDAPDAGGRAVEVDPVRVTQVFVNVLSNAIKYNAPAGRVRIAVDTAPLNMMRVQISDQGQGMSAAQLARLFEPFNRLGQERGAIEGTGIGLVIVKRLVDMMGGHIGIDSSVGVGTTVTVFLRRAKPAASAPATAALQPSTGDQPDPSWVKVVCVEDNEVNVALVRQVLEVRGRCQLHVAGSVAEGNAMIGRLRPQLAIVDMNLPDGTGLDVLAECARAEVPAIVISADTTKAAREAARHAGAITYLSKPLRIPELLAAIDQACRRNESPDRSPPTPQ